MPEELYDFEKEPCALNNLIGDQEHKGTIQEMQERLLQMMTSTGDPALDQFKARLEKRE